MFKSEWWKGKRGEWYVVVQLFIFALILFGPRTCFYLPYNMLPDNILGSILGIFMIIAGGILGLAGLFGLNKNLTIVPYPKDDAVLIESGSYRIVRHPIYSGLIFFTVGWSIFTNSLLMFLYSICLFVFFDIKARKEEKWLSEKFSDYIKYQKRVKKLIPFVY